MLISQCVEDISRFAAGDMDLQHTTDTLIDDMDRTESLGIRSFIVNNSRAIRRRLFPDLEDFEHIGYDGGSKDKINRKRLIGNTYQIYRSILHQLAIDEDWNNVITNMKKEEKKFVTEYQINGKKYAGEIWATSWEEAECFIKQRASTEKVVGFIPKD